MEAKKMRRRAYVAQEHCVACGACVKVCPREAIAVWKGCFAAVDSEKCIGCGKCAKTCPAGCITIKDGGAEDEK